MNVAHSRFAILLTVPLAFALTAGCNKSSQNPAANNANAPAPTSDQQVAVDVQAKILGDSAVQNKQMTINAKDGVVTLSGQVASDAERAAAASDASTVSGVKTVVNNLAVSNAAAQQAPAVNTPEVPPAVAEKARRSSPSHMARNTPPAPIHNGNAKGDSKNYSDTSNTASNTPAPNDAGNNVASAQPATPPPPAAPQKVTVPAGTTLSIRLSQPLASDKNQDGDTFKGSLQSSVTDENGNVAIPQGADVSGRVVSVKAAGKFAGQPQLALTLYELSYNGKNYSIQTDQWSKVGNSRTTSTAKKVGTGAAVGAVLGGIFGGGKGAAIGATAGAGAGAGAQTLGHADQVQLGPEAVIAFRLEAPVTVNPSNSSDNNRRVLEP